MDIPTSATDTSPGKKKNQYSKKSTNVTVNDHFWDELNGIWTEPTSSPTPQGEVVNAQTSATEQSATDLSSAQTPVDLPTASDTINPVTEGTQGKTLDTGGGDQKNHNQGIHQLTKEVQKIPLFSSCELDNGISVRCPTPCGVMDSYISRPVNNNDRDQVLEDVTLLPNEKIITDIFGIFRRDQDQLSPLYFSGNNNDIRVSFDVRKISTHLLYNANVRINGTWQRRKADFQDDAVCFVGGNIDILFLTSQPIIDEFVVTSEGWEYVCERDVNVKLTFPRNCVQQPQEIGIQVIPSETDHLRASLEYLVEGDLPCFIGVTNTIHVKHAKGIFRKPIGIQIDLDILGDQSLVIDQYILVDMHMTGDQLQIKPLTEKCRSTEKSPNRLALSVEVDDFDRHTFGLAHRKRVESRTAKLQAQLTMGLVSKCNILIFIQDRGHNNMSVLVECVESNRVQDTIKKRQNCHEDVFYEIPGCRSDQIFIPDGERIRIRVSGAISVPAAFRKEFMILLFLREGLHKFLKFPVNSTPGKDAYIECSSEKFSKGLVHQTYFNPSRFCRKLRTVQVPARRGNVIPPASNQVPARHAGIQELNPDPPANCTFDWSNIHRILSRDLITTNWKFPILAIFSRSGVTDGDKRVKEAENNNPGCVRDVIYEALMSWTDHQMQGKQPKQILEAILAGLRDERQDGLANKLTSRFS